MVVAARNPLAQMGFEDDYAYQTGSYGSSTSHLDISRYALKARGIDRIEKVVDSTSSSPTTVIQYPLYDAHGNMVATLSKGSSAGTYTVGNQRAFEPWGSVVDSSGLSNTPKQAYCASIGHVADGELGFTYMRARYYEPSTGRFISDDPARDGWNWQSYARNNPVCMSDPDGKFAWIVGGAVFGFISGFLIGLASGKGFWFAFGQGLIGAAAGALSAAVSIGSVALLGDTLGCVVGGAGGGAAGNGFNYIVACLTGSQSFSWKRLGRALGIGGALGLCFGAIGAGAQRNAEVAAAVAAIDADLCGNAADAYLGDGN